MQTKTKAKAPKKKAGKGTLTAASEPFVLLDGDPAADFEDLKERQTVKRYRRLGFDWRKPKKVLTKPKLWPTLKRVKAKKKGDKMATDIKQKLINLNRDVLTSIAWLLEAVFRIYIGVLLLQHFSNFVAIAAALYALGTAGAIIVKHFVDAHKA